MNLFFPMFIELLFGRSVQSLVKCGSCHCIFRLLQIFLPLFGWKTIVNLNNQSGSQYLTEWLLIYLCRRNRKILLLQNQWQVTTTTKSDNKIIFVCYFALNKLKLNMFCGKQSTNSAKQKEEKIVVFACYKIPYLNMTLRKGSAFWKIQECYEWWMMQPVMQYM